MTELPQLWELAAYRQAAEIAEAEEQVQLAAAVAQAGVTLADRARGATGLPVSVRVLGGTELSGTLELATDECLVLADGDDHRLIPIPACRHTVAECAPRSGVGANWDSRHRAGSSGSGRAGGTGW